MITKKEYNYVVNMFFKESPYAHLKDKKDVIVEFLKDFISSHSIHLELNKKYKGSEFSKLIRNFNNGKTYEELENGCFKIKNCKNWKEYAPLKADLIFFSYITKNYKVIDILKTHSEISFNFK